MLQRRLADRAKRLDSNAAFQSWTPLSLRGKADFHAIENVHDKVYAYDSTSETFMVSDDDGRTYYGDFARLDGNNDGIACNACNACNALP